MRSSTKPRRTSRPAAVGASPAIRFGLANLAARSEPAACLAQARTTSTPWKQALRLCTSHVRRVAWPEFAPTPLGWLFGKFDGVGWLEMGVCVTAILRGAGLDRSAALGLPSSQRVAGPRHLHSPRLGVALRDLVRWERRAFAKKSSGPARSPHCARGGLSLTRSAQGSGTGPDVRAEHLEIFVQDVEASELPDAATRLAQASVPEVILPRLSAG